MATPQPIIYAVAPSLTQSFSASTNPAPHQLGAHLATCVLKQVDPLYLVDAVADPAANGSDSEQYLDGHSREGDSGYGGSRSQRQHGARSIPLPCYEKPRCVSGKFPGGLFYVRAVLPTIMRRTEDGHEHTGDGNGSNGATGDAVKGNGGEGGGDSGPTESFATGAITLGDGNGHCTDSGSRKEEKAGNDDHERPGAEGYCLLRTDSLDRVCEIIYCGREAVEAKNLLKVVGVQLGYLQVSAKLKIAKTPSRYHVCFPLLFISLQAGRRLCVPKRVVVVSIYAASSLLCPQLDLHDSPQNLKVAFDNGEVTSWIDFFRRAAFTPLYHDRFPKLAEDLREVLVDGDEAAADLLSELDKVHHIWYARYFTFQPIKYVPSSLLAHAVRGNR